MWRLFQALLPQRQREAANSRHQIAPAFICLIHGFTGTMHGAFLVAGIGGLVFTALVPLLVRRAAPVSGQ